MKKYVNKLSSTELFIAKLKKMLMITPEESYTLDSLHSNILNMIQHPWRIGFPANHFLLIYIESIWIKK